MKVPASDVGGSNRLPVPGAEEEPSFAPANELLQHGRDHRMKVNLSICTRCLEPFFDFAMANLLLDTDGPEVGGDVLIDLKPKRLPDPQPRSPAQNEHHPLPHPFPRSEPPT